MKPKDRRRLELIQQAYTEVPDVACKGLCADACGVIAMSRVEYAHLTEQAGREPGVDGSGTCAVLVAGRCSAYEARPLICRLYGAVETLRCPHGCVPARPLTSSRGRALIAKVGKLGGGSRIAASAKRYFEALVAGAADAPPGPGLGIKAAPPPPRTFLRCAGSEGSSS